MKKTCWLTLQLFTLLLLASGCSSDKAGVPVSPAKDAAPDVAYVNGKIYTVNEGQPWAEAVAIKDGKFLAVGSTTHIERLVSSDTEIFDLDGKMVLPGLIDPHVHPSMDSNSPPTARLPGTFDEPTLEEIEEQLKQLADTLPANTQWVSTFGHDKGTFPPELYNRAWLDKIFPDVPVFMEDQTGHGALVNTKALELAGINRKITDPSGSRFVKDPETGEPNGELIEEGAMGKVRQLLPPATTERKVEALRGLVEEMSEKGFTAFGEAKTPAAMLDAWEAYFEEFGANHHVTIFMHAIEAGGVDTMSTADDLTAAWSQVNLPDVKLGAKIFLDGAIEGHTAYLLEPYEGQPDFVGEIPVTKEELRKAIGEYESANIQVKIHAIGDAAVRTALDTYQDLFAEGGDNALRHHIDHLNLVSLEDIPRFAKLNVPVALYPILAQPFEYQTALVKPEIGEERFQELTLPINRLFDASALVGFKSDWSSTPLEPFTGIEVAVTRQVPEQPELGTLGSHNATTLERAIRATTLNNAYILRIDDVTGSIEEGKLADMIVVSQNLFEIPVPDIHHTEVLKTVFKGEVVYEKR